MRAGTAESAGPEEKAAGRDGSRAFRGLVLVFALSFLSLIGVLLTVTALGGLGQWTRWQFIGLFGLIEAASGVASVILPNIWRLPVAEVQTRHSTEVKLAGSVILIPHWGGLARTAAGIVLMAGAAADSGVGPGTLTLPIAAILFAAVSVEVSALAARLGVARPDIDVVQIVLRRPRRETELPPISISASIVQFLLGIVTIPLIKALPPDSLYGPEFAPSAATLAGAALLAAVLGAATFLAWRGRIDWHAPREQQKEAEQFA
jgi:hypothetical protein